MNSAERYFSLLEAWINRGHAAAIGERKAGWDERFFSGLIMEIQRNSFWKGEYEPEDSLD